MATEETVQELLAILDLPEDGQYTELAKRIQPKPWGHINSGSFTPNSCDREYCRKCRLLLDTREDIESECPVPDGFPESLAELAFKLRDEVSHNWPLLSRALDIVWGRWCRTTWSERRNHGESKQHIRQRKFYLSRSKPVHWILAALIVKELEKENGTDAKV